MDALGVKKAAEAKAHIQDAEKSMKTSLFKRKPDLDSAATSYGQAALCYKIIKDHKRSIEMSTKAAELFVKHDSTWAAAKQYEQAALQANESKDYATCYELFEKATELMITTGTRDSAGILLERGGNLLKLTYTEGALKLYKRAIHVADVEGKDHESINYFENSINMAIRIGEFKQAIELIEQAYDVLNRIGTQEQITKYILTVVLIHLSRDDWVEGKKYLDAQRARYEIAPGTRGFGKVEDLLDAYDQKDDENMKHMIKNYLCYAVDNEVLKIAHGIVKSDEWLQAVAEITADNEKQPAPPASNNFINNNDNNYSSSAPTTPTTPTTTTTTTTAAATATATTPGTTPAPPSAAAETAIAPASNNDDGGDDSEEDLC